MVCQLLDQAKACDQFSQGHHWHLFNVWRLVHGGMISALYPKQDRFTSPAGTWAICSIVSFLKENQNTGDDIERQALKIFYLLLVLVQGHWCTHGPQLHAEIRGQLSGYVLSFHCGFQDLNSGHRLCFVLFCFVLLLLLCFWQQALFAHWASPTLGILSSHLITRRYFFSIILKNSTIFVSSVCKLQFAFKRKI